MKILKTIAKIIGGCVAAVTALFFLFIAVISAISIAICFLEDDDELFFPGGTDPAVSFYGGR